MAEVSIQVQVCHALPDSSFLRTLTVAAGATIRQAVEQSGLLQEVPGIDLAVNMVGIYGKKKPLDTVLREHDRIEVYRPLQADPKEARRRRASGKPAKT
ncbi:MULTISPECIES: RnfH family protein [unclassified Janthinobacterium]|uniref:RnfH family protein n=1 Tax=unclassified Janthinobacterium TaxID=2610881 RepID=UPI0025B0C0C9|nr:MULTISPECIES: RnfH family protein [unclassified Janthinobacterium]MDN2705703.1 RnfH family protein [Janthinobacterium sp. SUN100]MDO8040429.1 RnfH family protein [Janthinobacterium sp. SUN137]